ncbi:hypothetical protein ACLMJK_009584 [Lecanora helva]
MMLHFPDLIFVIIVFAAHIHAASLPLPSTGSNTSSLNTPLLNGELTCWDVQVFNRRRTRLIDCARAVGKLPYYHLPGEFHNAGEPDVFSLPYTVRYDRCEITISLDPYPGRAASSWLAVHTAASDIVFGCPNVYAPTAETGGELTVGIPKNVRVTVERARGPIAVASNSTADE